MEDTNDLLPTTVNDVSDLVKPFRFFDLPQELRDWCYDYMTGPTVHFETLLEKFSRYDSFAGLTHAPEGFRSDEVDTGALKLAIGEPPLVKILRVNRQMKFEYEQRANNLQQTKMIIYDHEANTDFEDIDPRMVDVPHFDWAKRADFLGVLHCQDFQCAGDVECTARFIETTVARLSKLSSVHVYLALQCEELEDSSGWPELSEYTDLQAPLRDLAEIDAVKELHVFRGRYDLCELKEIPSDDLLYISWTEKGGWVTPDLVREQPPMSEN